MNLQGYLFWRKWRKLRSQPTKLEFFRFIVQQKNLNFIPKLAPFPSPNTLKAQRKWVNCILMIKMWAIQQQTLQIRIFNALLVVVFIVQHANQQSHQRWGHLATSIFGKRREKSKKRWKVHFSEAVKIVIEFIYMIK